MPDDIDEAVLARFVHGDRDAFEQIFRRYEGEAYRWILRIVREPAAAEDALIEAFWRAYRSRARFDPSRGFGAWMRRIATNAALDQVKAAQRRNWVPLHEARSASSDSMGRVPRSGPREVTAITRAFRALPPKLQVVATLALVEECPQAEIADALDVPIGTVKSRLFRATRLLRQELTRMGVHT